ncbi:hypothetical protein EMPS_01598 [Entomortierella parvispora]|uniref:Protein kinase domain-containing protein n=1 Tax=Entomortierella parvispora TaxID=205924 RepID=A0A9P3H3A3_9FUNG|nr:hypothetical protein EMPS_01598 [Entomortierella parvispora]
MGNPFSKCCATDTTIPKKMANVVVPAPSASASGSLVDAQGQRIEDESPTAAYLPPKDAIAAKSTTAKGPSLFQRVSTQFASLSNSIMGPKSITLEQGLRTFPYPLTEDERKILLANEIPASEIKKLSIGVDAGGMGIIHVAEWKGIKVAIKEASIHVISKEVEIYSRMKGCESVVQFYGVTFPPGLDKMCIVTKYADKGSLTWHLKVEYQNLTWADKLRLATQISSGIARLHQEGIYHRDLHGGNILIDDQGDALLTDFGASTVMEERVSRNMNLYSIQPSSTTEGQSKFISQKIVGLESHQSSSEAANSNNSKSSTSTKKANINGDSSDNSTDDPLIGVMAYIAPERFRNPRHFDAKCDIYSLGVLLWELTTGHSAFGKVPQDVHLAVAIMNGKREVSIEGTPAAYKALYERCWDSNPEKRPSTEEILSTLAAVRESMTPEQLAVKRTRNNIRYESVAMYEASLSIPRPTSDIQQHFVS